MFCVRSGLTNHPKLRANPHPALEKQEKEKSFELGRNFTMCGLQLVRLLLLLLAFSGGVRAYNVDERARTVLTSGLSESSSAEEFFGFSMAHHRYSDGSQAYVAIIT